jgi:transposase, IS5 family
MISARRNFSSTGDRSPCEPALKHSKGGQFVAHAQARPGNPDDGHTLAAVIPAIEQLLGNTIERLHADAGRRGDNAPS